MVSLKHCLSLNVTSHQFIYQNKGPDAAPVRVVALADNVTEETDKDKKEEGKTAPEQKAEVEGKKVEKKVVAEESTKEKLSLLKEVINKGGEILRKLQNIIGESPDDIRYAVNTYAIGRTENPRRSPKDKKIMGKIIDAINAGKIDSPLIFAGYADKSKFKLASVNKLPESWHTGKVAAFNEILNSIISPKAIDEFIGENIAIIKGYIDCADATAREAYLAANESIFCESVGLFNIATAFQRSQQLRKDFPKAAPAGYHLGINAEGGRRFRTSGVSLGFRLLGRKPAPKKAPEVAKPYANSTEAIQEFDNAQAAFVKAAQEINSKYGTKLRFEGQFKGDKQTDKSLGDWTGYYNHLAENVIGKKGTLRTALASLSPEERVYIQRVNPTLADVNEKAKAWSDGDTTFKINRNDTAGQMLLTIRSRVTEFPKLVSDKLRMMKNVGFKEVRLWPDDVRDKKYDYDLLWKEVISGKKVENAIAAAKKELAKDTKDGAAKLEILKTIPLYLNPDNGHMNAEGYNKPNNAIALDYTENVEGFQNMKSDLLDGINDAYTANKGKAAAKAPEKAGR